MGKVSVTVNGKMHDADVEPRLLVPSSDVLESASQLASEGLKNVNADLHASEQYRRAMVNVFTHRALKKAHARFSPPV